MAPGSEWLSFHLAYPAGNGDRLLTDRVRPTVRALWQEQRLASFFFLRHLLGGPHLRIRLRPAPGRREEVRERVADDLADETIQELPFEPEVERYGGPERIGTSLDFFALQSARALRLLDHRSTVPPGEWLTVALRLEVRYILGFAGDFSDLEALIAEPAAALESGAELIRRRADEAFAASGEPLVRLLRGEIEKLGLAALSPLEDGEVARALRRELGEADRETRTRIFGSHLHLAANRLGLSRAEEAYLARILWCTFRRLEEVDPATWNDLGDLLVCRTAKELSPPLRLADLLSAAFATL
jgi:thiopeptide-type bacteriocin biosynthesis protein